MNAPGLNNAVLAATDLANAPMEDTGPVAAASPQVDAGRERRRIALSVGLGLLLLGALFSREVLAAVHTWNTSTAYNHCFLVIPITLYLWWDRRVDLVGIPPNLMPVAVVLALPLTLTWLISERLGIMEGRQLVAVSFAELLVLVVVGKRLWWALAGPLLYLYFLVPFGEFLTPKLQDITTWLIRDGLHILGVPAYIDGYIIDIPQGRFFVAEACAGLRFLIASSAFGCLYALMIYRSPMRRGLFILVSVIVPIIANGLRGLGIVYLGYTLNDAQAAAADHIIYGWVFFSAVILLLIAVGLPFRQDNIPARAATPPSQATNPPFPLSLAMATALGVVVLAAISPAVAAALTLATATRTDAPGSIDMGSDCAVRVAQVGALHVRTQRVVCGNITMDVTWEAFSPRITAAPLMAERRRLVLRALTEGLQENWLATMDEASSAWRIMTSSDPAFAIAVSMWVDGKPVRPGLAMRTRMAMNSLFGSTFAPMIVTVTPVTDWDSPKDRREAEANIPAFLLLHRDLDRTVGMLSMR